MADVKPPKRVTVLTRDAGGNLTVKAETTRSTTKKKGTAGLSLVEKIVRTGVNVSATATNSYLTRHNKSNEKKKDGWIKDAPVNVLRSGVKGFDEIKLSTFIGDDDDDDEGNILEKFLDVNVDDDDD